MLKKVRLSLILLILFSSCALSVCDANDICDESDFNNLTVYKGLSHDYFTLSSSNSLNHNYFVKEINIFDFFPPTGKTVDLYFDDMNVSVRTYNMGLGVDTDSLQNEILEYSISVMRNSSANIITLKDGIKSICLNYGIDDVSVNIDSSIGEDQIPIIFNTVGDSMLPTIKSGQSILVNKTHDIQVGDIVSAQSHEYGGICKRVGDIDGDSVFLISDNKNVSYEYYDGQRYESKGIRTWVNINEIDGVVIDIID